jgi:16S rRNA (cytosine967-C5)-methyltransferase
LRPSGSETRRLARDALVAIDDGGWANAVVPGLLAASQLPARDRALVTELVYGTCRRQRSCDWLVDRHTRGRPDHEVRAALRLGAYQLGWTRIPPHAAVSTTVAAVQGPGRSFVNAVLRRVAADLEAGPVAWPDAATEWSYPDWIVDRLLSELGPIAGRDALLTMNEPAASTTRADGYAQDRASQLVAAHVGARRGDRILDMCAAPGGKATALAGADPALVVAADISEARSAVTAAAVARLAAAPVVTVVADGARPPWRAGTFDRVLVDAPCSGLGVLRRRPDARWRVQPGDVERLGRLQRRLLHAAVPLVRPGGTLIYSVCTLTHEETSGIDDWLARSWPRLTPQPPPGPPWSRRGRGALLLPQVAGTDGMYVLAVQAPAVG